MRQERQNKRNERGGQQRVQAERDPLLDVLVHEERIADGDGPHGGIDLHDQGRPVVDAGVPGPEAGCDLVLVVEQDVNQAMKVADRVQCLLEGRTVLEGAPADLSREQIATAYFGI